MQVNSACSLLTNDMKSQTAKTCHDMKVRSCAIVRMREKTGCLCKAALAALICCAASMRLAYGGGSVEFMMIFR